VFRCIYAEEIHTGLAQVVSGIDPAPAVDGAEELLMDRQI
jgi:hypothetical protein